MGYIDAEAVRRAAARYGKSGYGEYLRRRVEEITAPNRSAS